MKKTSDKPIVIWCLDVQRASVIHLIDEGIRIKGGRVAGVSIVARLSRS